MTPEKLTGIVLSSRNIGETDRRIVLLTREKGKISAFARGAVKPRNPLVSSTQAFTFGEFFVYAQRDSYSLNVVNVIKHFDSFSKDLDKYYYASYMSEVADYYTRENLYAGDELLLLFQSYKALEAGTIGNELVRYIYDWRMLLLTGEYPDTTCCLRCGNKEKLNFFSAKRHGLLCDECANELRGDIVPVLPGTLYTLQYILGVKLQKLYTFTLKPEILDNLKSVSKAYLKEVRNVKFNSKSFIDDEGFFKL